MATTDENTDTQTTPAPGAVSPDMLTQAMALAKQFMPQPVQQDTTPVSRSWTSLLGEALGGGPPVAGMTDTDRELAGHQALMQFGTGLMAASRYQPGQTIFSNLAGGLQGAQRGEVGAEEMAMSRLGAQQEYAQQQAQNKLEALKTALPYLQLQMRQGLPSPFAQGAGGPPAPNVAQGGSISAGAGGAAPALTGDLETDRKIIAQRESGGNPTALNYVAQADPTAYARGATASGKYQFVNSTWQDGMKLAGLDPSKYPTAMSAPESVQDQVFTAVYKRDGTKPWDASTFKQNWVPTPTGQMILANVVPGTKAAPATAGGPSATPAPYKVAGPTVAPPSGTTAPATATPAADDTFFPNAPSAAPAPQQTSQADQPPAQPPVTTPPAAAPLDIKSAPDTTLTPEQYVLKHWTPLSPEEVQRYAPGPDNQLAVDRARQVQQAQADAAAARQTYLNVQSGRVPGDLNKSLSDMNTADARADAAEKDYNTAVQGLKTEGAKNLLAADDQQRQQLRADFKSTVTDPAQKAIELAQTAAENEKNRQNQIAIETLKGKQAIEQAGVTSDIQAGQKALEAVNATRDGAKDTVNNLEVAKNFSKLAGTSGFLQQWPQVSNFLIRNNLLTSDEVQQMGAQKGLDAVMNKVILSMRAGSGMSRMTNFDLQFLQNTAPSSFTPEQMRPAMFAAIQTAASRQVEYADRVNELHASGMPVWQARQQADEDLGHMVKEVPTVFPKDDPRAGQPMSVDDQNKWIIRKVTPGTFYVQPSGALAIRGEPKQAQQ